MRRNRTFVPPLVLAAFVVLSLLSALLPHEALAADVRGGNAVVVEPTEVVNDDLYAWAQDVTIRGTVNGDVVVAGNTLRIEGAVGGDVIAAGGTVTVTGPVRGSVRAAGGTVTVESEVGEDVLLAGQTLTLSPSGSAGRDFLVAGSTATLDGTVGRNVSAGTSNLTIGGLVGGDVRADVQTLRLTDQAMIDGRLVYTSDQEASIAPDAVVRGGIERSERPEGQPPPPLAGALALFLGWLRALVGLFALGLVLVLVFPRFAQNVVETLGTAPWPSLGLGCGFLVVLPIVALLIFVVGLFIGGWWLGLMLLAIYGIVLALGYVVSGLLTGRWVLWRAGRPGVHLAWALLLGLALLLLVGLIPIVGGIVSFVAVLFGAGALLLAIVRLLSRHEAAPAA